MPRYHYKCNLCESEVSVIHCFDDVYTECEKCESTGSMHKMITRPNIKTLIIMIIILTRLAI